MKMKSAVVVLIEICYKIFRKKVFSLYLSVTYDPLLALHSTMMVSDGNMNSVVKMLWYQSLLLTPDLVVEELNKS